MVRLGLDSCARVRERERDRGKLLVLRCGMEFYMYEGVVRSPIDSSNLVGPKA
jgi:hypothetical protein